MATADLRARREAQLGLAHETTSLAGRLTMLVTIGPALIRRAQS